MPVFQSNLWHVTTLISKLVFLKFRTAFGVVHSSENVANDRYLNPHLITRS